MEQYVVIIIFEDGNVDMCKVRDKVGWMELLPLEENTIIVDDFKIACTSRDELIDELRLNYKYIDYIAVKHWKTFEELRIEANDKEVK